MAAKQDKKVDKAVKNNAESSDEEKKAKSDKKKNKAAASGDESSDAEEKISEKEAIRLRKFLESGCEFMGFAETAIAVVKKTEARQMKIKELTKTIQSVFKLSEEYDSDESDIEDDLKWLTDSKKIRKQVKKIDNAKL